MNKTARETEVDSLTGLPGYDAFMLAVSMRKPKGAQESIGDSFSLGLVDLDGFGALNKEHGSETGDEALRSIATRLSEAAGDRAVAYRYGGDAFMLLFPNTEKEQAFLVMERARKALEGKYRESDSDSPTPSLTVSMGVAAYPDDGATARPSVARAASFITSARVGWACDDRAMSSLLAPNSMATAASAIKSPARGPIMWTPKSRSVSA